MRKILSIIIAAALLILPVASATASSGGPEKLDEIIDGVADYVLRTVKTPKVGTAGGEWAVIGLARSGYDVPDSYFEDYYALVEKYVADSDGLLSAVRYTEYSRIILSLSAAGYDPKDVTGYDLTAPLGDLEGVCAQGVNSLIYALLALDSKDYPNELREAFIAEILRRELDGGGWNLSGGISAETKKQPPDPDVTGMVLQAFAKYQNLPDVESATDRAIARLSEMQEDSGGFIGWESENIESSVQILVALCELGLPHDDPRFVKNGNTIVDSILTFMNPDYSFNHIHERGAGNQMSSEQALYGLVAVQRASDGRNSLYRMQDVTLRAGASGDDPKNTAGAGLPGKNAGVCAAPVIDAERTFADIQGHKNQKATEALAARGIINGRSDSEFAPDETMTRAEFATITVRGTGLGGTYDPRLMQNYFGDVAAGDWFFIYVGAAAYYGIVKGVSETAFSPGSTITRQEAAVMVARAAGLCGMDTTRAPVEIRDTLSQFGDYRTVAEWAQESVAFCFDVGIMDDSMLDIEPTKAILRCEIAEMLYRLLFSANLI